MKKIIIVYFIIFTMILLMGCNTDNNKKNISYNGVMIGSGVLGYNPKNNYTFKDGFLEENRVRCSYENENYDPNDSNSEKYIFYAEAPKEIIFVIDSIEKHDEIFNQKHEVDYEKEILILRLFASTNCSWSLSEVELEDNVLKIIYDYVVNVTTEPGVAYMLIRIDKIEFETVEFYYKMDYRIINKGKSK